MTIQIYNSLTGRKEDFQPIEEDRVRMYVCGQTVYDYMHIGHGRTYIAFDIIRRFLEHQGYTVETVVNITDINDKINNRAEEEGRSPEEVAEEFTQVKLEDFQRLDIHADVYPQATHYVQEMIETVEELLDKGYAYESGGNVFFDVRKLEDYGKLSNQNIEDIEASRDDIKDIDAKKNLEDFVLWRSRDPEESTSPTWDSPWGRGVPGWHIECSAMSTRLLGEQFDIHGGGADLVFPHHEDEIAQAEGATGKKPWVKYWMHAGLVRMDDEKMSKSLGNFVSTRELLKDRSPEVLRLMVAMTHYRKPMDYSREKVEEAEERLESLENTIDKIQAEINASELSPGKMTDLDLRYLEKAMDAKKKFIEAMEDDFNTPEALKHLFELEKVSNTYIDSEDNPKRTVLDRLEKEMLELSEILGIKVKESSEQEDSYEYLDLLLEVREMAREQESFDISDRIREKLNNLGVEIEDTPRGPRWVKKS
ncbi:MAG: cysteine--tRNA ligase [Candidatus Nanohaloarchaea archaeon]|nr:cysteine--tRNA ligase [Candidatus Nanohaloarchaea archaeon]